MKEMISTITSKGQLTVPIEVRRQLDLKQGDKVVFQLTGQEVTLIPASSRLAAGFQLLPALDHPQSEGEIEELVAEERGQAYLRQLREGNA